MIVKSLNSPIKLQMEEALLRRLPLDHKKRPQIEQSFKKNRAGFRGEQNLAYYLEFLPNNDYHILYDLRLCFDNKVVQLDTLILHPQFSIIIESKNIYGHLFFDQHSRQLIRTYEGEEEGFPNPLTQAKRQKSRLEEWLKLHHFKPFPIEFLVSVGTPGTVLKTNPNMKHIFQKVLHAEHIPDKIVELQQEQPSNKLTPYYLQKMTNLLLEHHTPAKPNLLQWYEIKATELLTGVQCPKCSLFAMDRIHGGWLCPHCKHTSNTAHQQAIRDYLLFHPTITNQECRQFLHLSSRCAAKRLLQGMQLPFTGAGKGRVYGRL